MSIGQELTAARESAGLSVEEVAARTRMRRTLVTAIENDDYALCGGEVYARGHIRNIARVIDTDPVPLLERFDAAHPVEAPLAVEVFRPDRMRSQRRGPNRSAAMAAALVLVVAYGLVQAFTGGSGGSVGTSGRAADQPRPSVITSQPPAGAQGPGSPSGAASAAPRKRPDVVTVRLRAKSVSWVKATSGRGRALYEGLLAAGQVKTFRDTHRVQLVVGNAGGVKLTVNGTSIGAPGRTGQVARVQFGRNDPAHG